MPIETGWPTATFASPVPLDGPDAIRRLAPAVPLGDFALVVKEQEGKLVCTGCCVLHRPSFSGALPEFDRRLDSLMIRVDGPGRLRLSGPFPTILYRAGKIAALRPIVEVPQVRQWLQELTDTVAAGLAKLLARRPNKDAIAPESVSIDAEATARIQFSVQYVWSTVLGTAVDLGHGGMFVILPSVQVDPETARQFRSVPLPPMPNPPIALKYKGAGIRGLGLGSEIIRYWLNEFPSAISGSEVKDLWSYRQNWMHRKVELSGKARAFGNFSAVDGCVVLNRGLDLIGFGGEIRVDDAMLKQSPRTFVDPQTGKPKSDEELDHFGTRHRSAFRLCKMVGGALVFVISQDGDLRLFSSDDAHVYLDQDLSHLVLQADHC